MFCADIIKGNSFELDGWTLNEGGSGFKINLKPGVKRGTWKTNLKDYYNNAVSFIDVGLSIDTKDTMLVLYHYSKNYKEWVLNKVLQQKSVTQQKPDSITLPGP